MGGSHFHTSMNCTTRILWTILHAGIFQVHVLLRTFWILLQIGFEINIWKNLTCWAYYIDTTLVTCNILPDSSTANSDRHCNLHEISTSYLYEWIYVTGWYSKVNISLYRNQVGTNFKPGTSQDPGTTFRPGTSLEVGTGFKVGTSNVLGTNLKSGIEI